MARSKQPKPVGRGRQQLVGNRPPGGVVGGQAATLADAGIRMPRLNPAALRRKRRMRPGNVFF